MGKNLNIIISPVKRWFHYEKINIEDERIKILNVVDHKGNEVPVIIGEEAYRYGREL